jgi:hypothetical protein
MSHTRHHAIIVTSPFTLEKQLETAHRKASEIFPYVSPLAPGVINGVRSFFIPPDGSSEGREESEQGDMQRQEFINWLITHSNEELEFSEDMSVLQWVEVQYGDDHEESLILNQSKPPDS